MDDTDLVGQEFVELASFFFSHLPLGSSPVCYNPGDGARTRPFRTVRSLLSKGCGQTAPGKLHFLSSAALVLMSVCS
jgi:hypothetical protein